MFHPVWKYGPVVQFTKAHLNELEISYNMHEENIFEDLSNLTILKPFMYAWKCKYQSHHNLKIFKKDNIDSNTW